MGKIGYKSKQSTQETFSFQRLKYLALQEDQELEKEMKWISNFFGTDLVKIKHFNVQACQEWCDEQSFITNKKPIKHVEEELNKIEVEYLKLTECFIDKFPFYQTNERNKVFYELINSQPNSTQVANQNLQSTNTTRVKVNKLEI
ncbi:hypothetical protein [Mycoplasma sp. VS509_3]|uniref:hypothetical protein n=1 Tax=unclassified Mycoplasma TaxID=2683645 RepID=UPI003AAB0AAA